MANNLLTKGIQAITPNLPLKQTYLEKFDYLGYKQIELRLYPDRLQVLWQLNKGQQSHKQISKPYDDLIELYTQNGFHIVSEAGELEEKIPSVERPNIFAKRLTFDEFKNEHPNIAVMCEGDYWQNGSIDLYYEDTHLNETISLVGDSCDAVFEQWINKVFLKNLHVDGGISGTYLESSCSILVCGNTKADYIFCREGFMKFNGDIELNNTFTVTDKAGHGSFFMGTSLCARAYWDETYLYSSATFQGDYCLDIYKSVDRKKNQAMHYVSGKNLAAMFPDSNWIELDSGGQETEFFDFYAMFDEVDPEVLCDRLDDYYDNK